MKIVQNYLILPISPIDNLGSARGIFPNTEINQKTKLNK